MIIQSTDMNISHHLVLSLQQSWWLLFHLSVSLASCMVAMSRIFHAKHRQLWARLPSLEKNVLAVSAQFKHLPRKKKREIDIGIESWVFMILPGKKLLPVLSSLVVLVSPEILLFSLYYGMVDIWWWIMQSLLVNWHLLCCIQLMLVHPWVVSIMYTVYVPSYLVISYIGLTSFYSEIMKGTGAAERLFDLMNQQSPIKLNCMYSVAKWYNWLIF